MKSLIGKEWRDAKDGKVIEVKNPATNELVDTVPSLSAEEVAEAVDYAYEAQKEWAKVPVHEKCDIMMKFVSLVERDKDSLAKTLSDETGKPIKEAYNEINSYNKYNYVVVNDKIENAVSKVKAIIQAEKCRVERIEEIKLDNKEELIHEILIDKDFNNDEMRI